MSFILVRPELLSAAATDLANIGSTIASASAAAANPTTGLLAAGADEVSVAIATVFGSHAQAYQAASAELAQFHQQGAGGNGGFLNGDGGDGGDGGRGNSGVASTGGSGGAGGAGGTLSGSGRQCRLSVRLGWLRR